MDQITEILQQALSELRSTDTLDALKELRVRVLGKKGSISTLMKGMGKLAPEERPVFGQKVNEARTAFETEFEAKKNELENAIKEAKLASEKIDVTLPTGAVEKGVLHPLTQVYREVRDVCMKLGFNVVEGPEMELDKFNFELLNIPKEHPARDMQDTFYINPEIVLRTHTSPVQARTMLTNKPPIRVICPGKVYRQDDVDATHSPVFRQIEGLVIDKGVTFADLRAMIDTILKALYGEDTQTRFRPGFFPFTEPSAEVDATCSLCKGKGCPACKGAGMIEVLGCGMVNPRVLEMCGLDPEVYSGYAFGLGLDRLSNIKYGVTDIRLNYENDVRFLRQFR
ncbi:MAG: phenylalanine--tRNA ligase subunit alpha [Clostridiales bacterium]|nr:phenylalanine--tRNA ligase subunit alpha [Clostridiales bacterium]MBR3842080.1 phenylalanine--tRNA ligase subunit alpha [Christensenellaceae bacterium]